MTSTDWLNLTDKGEDPAMDRFTFSDDELTLVIKEVEAPGEPALRVIRLDAGSIAARQSAEALIDELMPAFDPEMGPPPFVMDIHRGWYSWGAEHSGAELVLQVALGFLGAGGWEAVKAGAQHLLHSWSGDFDAAHPLSADESRVRARWMVAASFDIDEESLTVVSESEGEGGIRGVRLRDERGSEYEVEFELRDELVVMTRLSHSNDAGV